VVQGLLDSVAQAEPDVVAVSGDLTQRARTGQFKQARAFLAALPRKPTIVVPGNHDVSTTNLVERFTRPLDKYRKYITRDLEPYYADAEIAIAGVNTVRLLSTKDGRINRRQVACACERLGGSGGVVRVVVTHHPMDLPMTDTKHALVGRASRAVAAFAECGVDLFLSGHLHAGTTVATSARYGSAGYSAIVAQAGTAASTRTRGEANAWNLIRAERSCISIRQMVWNGKKFVRGDIARYRRGETGWSLEEA
jgi:3',5'-cyclic AMP phosphodiesterase CpdA